MAKRRFTRLICVFLLLFAQQVAVTHAVWHAGKHAPVQKHGDKGDASFQAKLCGLDGTFSQVLGAVQAGEIHHSIPASRVPAIAHRSGACVVPELHVPLSRGPPALS